MSRSVDYLTDSIGLAFIKTSAFVGSEDDDGYLFREECENVATRLAERWPSFESADYWDGREVRVVAENGHAIVGVSEYCGLTSVSIAVRGDSEYPELAENWIRGMADEFEKMFGNLKKVATFSNGEAFYERVS